MKTTLLPLLAIITLSLLVAAPAGAERNHGDDGGGGASSPRHDPSTPPPPRPVPLYTGHWFKGQHDGRIGWWWVIDDSWFPQPEPPLIGPNVYAASPPHYTYSCPAADAGGHCLVPWQQTYVP